MVNEFLASISHLTNKKQVAFPIDILGAVAIKRVSEFVGLFCMLGIALLPGLSARDYKSEYQRYEAGAGRLTPKFPLQ